MKFRFRKNSGIHFGALIFAESLKDFGVEVHLLKWTITLERV
jgi:hypothetical protein